MISLDGESLHLDQVRAVACSGEPVEFANDALKRMRQSRAVIESLALQDRPVYGVNTGFGQLADVRIDPDRLESLQHNILRSHACGVGDPLPEPVVRAIMLIRTNVLARGFSGIRAQVAKRLLALLNKGVTPVAPSRGSVGASGDLAPLAHIALVLIGEGAAFYLGRRLPGAEALAEAGIEPLSLQAKEGISLVNGTQAMLATGGLALLDAEDLLDAADAACALSLDALRGSPTAFDERIHRARPHPGQIASAARLREWLEGSQIRSSHQTCRRVQDAYSLRCAPQVHGAAADALAEARRVVDIELNSATDNPLVFDNDTLSGGNFHGQPLALAFDYAALALCSLAGISERRVDRLVNPALNEGLPPFLAQNPGLESGLMMLQVTAASLVAELRVLANPASPGSITTSGNKEDFVSMGMTSALKFQQMVDLTRLVLAIELVTATHALETLRPLNTGTRLELLRAELVHLLHPALEDRPRSAEIEAVSAWIREWRTRKTAWSS
ncbi:MAG: histidine ammonia-lyase [Bryobacteraceae bacterium]|nr:histidine ammonia-lyase [Solibacteraceae bacterium]MCO5351540.1 histidine ammonia-lyase [Bryobacteraceae bacterium]